MVFALPVLGHHRGKFSLLWHAQTLIAEPNAVEGKISTTSKPRWAKRKAGLAAPCAPETMGFDNRQLGTAVPTLRLAKLGRLLEGGDDLGDFFSRHSEIRHRTEGVRTGGKQTDTRVVKPLG